MKILHAPYGAQMTIICPALRELGIEATSCHLKKSKFKFKPDLIFSIDEIPEEDRAAKQNEFFGNIMREYDIFHFHHGSTFFPDFRDLDILKKSKKKMVMQHRGSDVRLLDLAKSYNNPYVRVKKRNAEQLVNNLDYISSYIEHVIVADHELVPYVKDFYRYVHVIPQAIQLKEFVPVYPPFSYKDPVIAHAPSNPKIKGTEYVLDAIQKLKDKGYKFEFLLVRGAEHEEALRIYQTADIIIDQLLIGSFGILSLEGMAFGKPVICYIRKDLKPLYPGKLPIINADPTNIYTKLKNLLDRREKLFEIGIKSRRYVKEFHDSKLIAKKLIEVYESL